MEELGTFVIKIDGYANGEKLTPGNFDIREISALTTLAEELIFGSEKKKRPPVAYDLAAGSVLNKYITAAPFVLAASLQLEHAAALNSLIGMDPVRAGAVVKLQDRARAKGWDFVVGAPDYGVPLTVTPNTTFKVIESREWFETELYFYGLLQDLGGTSHPNIHLDTSEGMVKIAASKDYLGSLEQNLLYKMCSVRAIGRQDALTGEVDQSSLKVQEIKRHKPYYDEEALTRASEKATRNWLGDLKDPEAWLRQLRGYDD